MSEIFGLIFKTMNSLQALGFNPWGGVGRAVDGAISAGSTAKKWADSQRDSLFDEKFSSFCNLQSLPDLSVSHISESKHVRPGTCHATWTDLVALVLARPEDEVELVRSRDSHEGEGWIGFGHAEEVFILFEGYTTQTSLVLSQALYFDEYWIVFKSTAERGSQDNSPCKLTYSAEAFRPNRLMDIFLGVSDSSLEDMTITMLDDCIMSVRDIFETSGQLSISLSDEIQKLADLLKDGLITQQEFDAAKRKLIEK